MAPPTVPLVKGGQVKALAVTGAVRSAELPDVPSMAEAGLAEVNTGLWSGLFVQAATPAPIVKKLEETLRKVIADPEVSAKLKAHGGQSGRRLVGGIPRHDRRGYQDDGRRREGGEFEVRGVVANSAGSLLLEGRGRAAARLERMAARPPARALRADPPRKGRGDAHRSMRFQLTAPLAPPACRAAPR